MHLGFHAPCYDDEWCWCPFSKISNNKWHEGVTAEFDEKDNADPQKYTSDELQTIVTKPVVGMKGISFVPYTGMSVFAFRGDNEVKVEIVQVYQKNAKLKWVDDNSLSILCVPYNQIRPVSKNDEVDEQADEVEFLRRCISCPCMHPFLCEKEEVFIY